MRHVDPPDDGRPRRAGQTVSREATTDEARRWRETYLIDPPTEPVSRVFRASITSLIRAMAVIGRVALELGIDARVLADTYFDHRFGRARAGSRPPIGELRDLVLTNPLTHRLHDLPVAELAGLRHRLELETPSR